MRHLNDDDHVSDEDDEARPDEGRCDDPVDLALAALHDLLVRVAHRDLVGLADEVLAAVADHLDDLVVTKE